MRDRSECPHCKRGPLVAAKIQGSQEGRLVVESGQASHLAALVCTACGHVELRATDPHALRPPGGEEPEVQEYDF